jgi:hypothetical protein
LLSVAGLLDDQLYGRSFDIQQLPIIPRRTLYAAIDRQNLPGLFRNFDFASPEQHVAQRVQTTVPQQSLYLLNSRMMESVVRSISDQFASRRELCDEQLIAELFRLILAREVTQSEIKLARDFLQTAKHEDYSSRQFDGFEQLIQVLLMSNEFCYAD